MAVGSHRIWCGAATQCPAWIAVTTVTAGFTHSHRPRPVSFSTALKDLRTVTTEDFEGFDAVIHLAELSNDPLGQNNPEITFEINHEGSVRIAQLAKAAGVRRFVYASSCSVYGVGSGEFLDETSPTNPQTAYAQCKVLVERDVATMADDDFSRRVPAQRHGLRPVAAHALRHRAERPVRAGLDDEENRDDQRRHALAADRAHRGHLRGDACALEAPARRSTARSSTSAPPTRTTASARSPRSSPRSFPGCEVSVGPPSKDNRSYRVSFEKIATRLPGFKARWTARRAPRNCTGCSSASSSMQQTFEFRAFTRLKQLKYLQRTGQIDDACSGRDAALAQPGAVR